MKKIFLYLSVAVILFVGWAPAYSCTTIAVGIITFSWPEVTALLLLFVIAAWALVTGVFEITASIRLPSGAKGKWMLGLSGLLSVILGLILVFRSGAGVLALIWIIGAYAIITGITLSTLAFTVRSEEKQAQRSGTQT